MLLKAEYREKSEKHEAREYSPVDLIKEIQMC